MPTPQFSRPNDSAGMDEIRNYLAMLWKELTYIMSKLDSKNIRAEGIEADRIKALSITAVQISAGTITANKMNVTELSAIAANLGTIIAGTITGVTITGGTVQTATSGSRVVMTGNIITIYDSNGVKRVTIDSTTLPPKINYYDSSAVLNTTIAEIGGTFFISSAGGASYADDTAITFGRDIVPTNILGTVKIRSATKALHTITQTGTSGATLAQLEAQVNTMIQNLRAMNIYAT